MSPSSASPSLQNLEPGGKRSNLRAREAALVLLGPKYESLRVYHHIDEPRDYLALSNGLPHSVQYHFPYSSGLEVSPFFNQHQPTNSSKLPHMTAFWCMKAPQAIAAPVTPTKMSACLARCHWIAGCKRSKWATSTLTRRSLKRGCSNPDLPIPMIPVGFYQKISKFARELNHPNCLCFWNES